MEQTQHYENPTPPEELTPEQRELAESIEAEEAEKREKQARQAERLQALGLPADDPELLELAPYFLNITDPVPPQRFAFQLDGKNFAPVGDIHLITAAKKSAKTFFVHHLIGAALSPTGWEGITCNIPNAKILYIDTEQHETKTKEKMQSDYVMAALSMEHHDPRLQVIKLRTEPDRKRREELIDKAIKLVKPDLVFLDGTSDVAESVNSEEEAKRITRHQMAICEKYKCSIWNLIHLPKSKEGATSARGFLGTEIENAACDIFRLEKVKLKNGDKYYIISHESRNEDLPDYKFIIKGEQYDGIYYPVTREIKAPSLQETLEQGAPPPVPKSKRDELQELLEGVFGSVRTLGTATITQRLQQATGKCKSHADHLKGEAKKMGLIIPVEGQANTYQLASRSTDEQLTLLDNGTEHEHTEATQSTPQASAMSEGTEAPDGLPFTPPDGEGAPF